MSFRICTPGHIRCIKWLDARYENIIIGLLTDKALNGYKISIMPFNERLEILKYVAKDKRVVPQDSLDPSENIEKYKPTHIASGDGWEQVEEEAIKKFNLVKIDIPLPKEFSSTNIINKIKNENYSSS
jgi:glycerol-3-phosphate cytidylyltransferase